MNISIILFAITTIFLILIKYIAPVVLILSAIIWILKANSISKIFKIIVIVITLLCVFIMLNNYRDETPDNLYTEMKEIDNDQSLIGKSNEEIVELLGKPKYETTNRDGKRIYEYFAGRIRKEWFWGKCYSTECYEFSILFDENDKVEYTHIQLTPSD